MGLDTSHNAWHGPYSSFNTWRREIAKCIGIPLDLMQGFWPEESQTGFMHPLGLVISMTNYDAAKVQLDGHIKNFPLKWSAFTPNPLHELLYHSDCDGEIEWEKCRDIANELEKLLPLLPDHPTGFFHDKTKQFIAGCRLAFSRKENIDFH